MTLKRLGWASLLVAMLAVSGCKEQTLAIGQPAPDLAVLDNQKNKMTLDEAQGQPVVVEFWSSTCGACLVMMKAWQDYVAAHPGKIRFIGVGIPPFPNDLPAFADKLGVDLPLGLDQLGITQERYQVVATPTTFFIDRHGVLREQHIGYSPGMDFDRYVNAILK